MNDMQSNASADGQDQGSGRQPKVFHILVNHKPHEWPNELISGLDIKTLAGMSSAAYDVWQEIKGADDKVVSDQDEVTLSEHGAEKFLVLKKATTEG